MEKNNEKKVEDKVTKLIGTTLYSAYISAAKKHVGGITRAQEDMLKALVVHDFYRKQETNKVLRDKVFAAVGACASLDEFNNLKSLMNEMAVVGGVAKHTFIPGVFEILGEHFARKNGQSKKEIMSSKEVLSNWDNEYKMLCSDLAVYESSGRMDVSNLEEFVNRYGALWQKLESYYGKVDPMLLEERQNSVKNIIGQIDNKTQQIKDYLGILDM